MSVVTFAEPTSMYLMDFSTARTNAIMTFVEDVELEMNKNNIYPKTTT